MPLLSICIPTYNRSSLLKRLFDSIDSSSQLQLVICDDGSTDDTEDVAKEYSEILNISYFKQSNLGRAIALHNAIKRCEGQYTMIMDSDDYFIPASIDKCLERISLYSNYSAFVFGTLIIKKGATIINNPPDQAITNFTAMRADLGWKNDLKEVVLTKYLQDVNFAPPKGCRRVPTTLLWESISTITPALSFRLPLVVKEYYSDGMTKNLLKLQCTNPGPLIYLNYLYIYSKNYRSLAFRLKSIMSYGRFYLHAGDFSGLAPLSLGACLCAFPIFLFDNLRLWLSKS